MEKDRLGALYQIVVPEQHLPRQYYLLLKKIEFYCRRHHQGKAMTIFALFVSGTDGIDQ